jgi:mannose-6-phosphate isomerase-like protein (cupin superfamily)
VVRPHDILFFNIPAKNKKEVEMSSKDYPYVNHMNILYSPLQLIDIQSLVAQCTDQWYNQTLCQVNDSVVRLGILHGEYHWHKHDKEDEFFFTLDGKLIIDLEGQESVELYPQQGYVVPRGIVHKTRAPEKTVVLMIETAGIVPTGDDEQPA